MIKLLFTGLIVYGVYKYFIAPTSTLNRANSDTNSKIHSDKEKETDEDYIDYEEVD